MSPSDVPDGGGDLLNGQAVGVDVHLAAALDRPSRRGWEGWANRAGASVASGAYGGVLQRGAGLPVGVVPVPVRGVSVYPPCRPT